MLKKDTGVIQAQQLDSLSNAFLDIVQKKGCIPTVQMYLKVANVPVVRRRVGGLGNDAGRVARAAGQGEGLGAEATRRSSSAPTRTSARA